MGGRGNNIRCSINKYREEKKKEKKSFYCTCHAVSGIFSSIYGVRQSAAADGVNLLAMHLNPCDYYDH